MALLAMPEVIEAQEYKILQQPQHTSLKNLQIRVLGVSQSGAKSRVETQIKLCLQLVTDKGEKVPLWSHLRLPEYMVAKEKLKTKNARNTQGQPMNIVEKSVLNLEATVVCASEIPKKVLTCLGCVQRERKRSQRKKEHKLAKANANGSSVGEEGTKSMDLDDEKSLQLEQRKILLFNCSEIVDFSSGDTILPTRITCYCRHHNEKIGFCIIFEMKDHTNRVIAAGMSPPIMITDDHKSSKTKVGPGRKRPRAELYSRNSSVPSDSPKSPDGLLTPPIPNLASNAGYSGSSSPILLLSPSSNVISVQPQSVKRENTNMVQIQSSVGFTTSSPSPLSPLSPMSPLSPNTPAENSFDNAFQIPPQLDQTTSTSTSIPLLNNQSNVLVNLPMPQGQLNGMNALYQPIQLHQSMNGLNRFNVSNAGHQAGSGGPMRLHNSVNPNQMLRRSFFNGGGNAAAMFSNGGNMNRFIPPKMSRLIPSEGPVYGGIEVTVLGSNFFDGLTCMFGDCPAIPTQYWGPNTLVCLLPPASTPGPVVVSFKEFLLDSPDQELTFFTYQDDSDRALMELALQVVGMKMTGKLEDARNIAMRIVGGGENDDGGSNHNSSNGNGMSNTPLSVLRGSTLSSNLEEHIIKTLNILDAYETEHPDTISLRNATGHTMLHLATMRGYELLTAELIERGVDLNTTDGYGFTALHYAAWTGRTEIVRLLLTAGASDIVRNSYDQYATDLAMLRDFGEIVNLIDHYQHDSGVSLSPTSSDELDSDAWYDESEEEETNEDIQEVVEENAEKTEEIPIEKDSKDDENMCVSENESKETSTPHISWVDSETAVSLLQETPAEDGIVNAEVLGTEVEEDVAKLKQPLTNLANDLATVSTIWLQKTFAHLHMPTLSKPSQINIQLPNLKMPYINMQNLHNFSSQKFSNMTFTHNLSIPRPSMPSMPSLYMNIEFPTLPTVTLPALLPSGFTGIGRDEKNLAQSSAGGEKSNIGASDEVDNEKLTYNTWDHYKKMFLGQGTQEPTRDKPAADQDGGFLRFGGWPFLTPASPPVPMYRSVKHASRRVGYDISDQQTAAYEQYEQKIRRIKKDRMLYLFWVPALLVMIALAYVRYFADNNGWTL